MTNQIEKALQKIDDLDKKTEIYYKHLYLENELSFILKGQYFLDEDLANILQGNY